MNRLGRYFAIFIQQMDLDPAQRVTIEAIETEGKNQALRFVFKGETQPAMKMWLDLLVSRSTLQRVEAKESKNER